MPRRDDLYQIVVRCENHAYLPRVRIVARESDAAGIDSAVRELRRIRRTVPDGKNFDRWDLYDYSRGNRNRTLVAEGNLAGADRIVIARTHHRAATAQGGTDVDG
jgi:hypothetical protein